MKYRTSQPRDLDHQPPRTAQKCAPLRHEKKIILGPLREQEVGRTEDANSMKEHEEEEEQQEEYKQQNGQPDIPHHTATSSRECNLYAYCNYLSMRRSNASR
jgi:hypothetical protein